MMSKNKSGGRYSNMRREDGKGPKWSCMAKYAMSTTTKSGKVPCETLKELMHNVRSGFIGNG